MGPSTVSVIVKNRPHNSQREYWNTIAQAVNDRIAVNHWVDENDRPVSSEMFTEIARFLVERYGGAPAGRVLEVGCGNSLLLAALSELLPVVWELHGIDISEEMIARSSPIRAKLRVSAADTLCYDNAMFDLVFMHSVVQYFSGELYLRAVLAECIRTVRPGGSICIMDVPAAWHLPDMVRRCFWQKAWRKARGLLMNRCGKLTAMRRGGQDHAYQIEKVNGQMIRVPRFVGYYPDLDLFYDYAGQFQRVSIEVQPFRSKPQTYRKYRYNVILESKIV